MFCFSNWVLVTQVCSVWENPFLYERNSILYVCYVFFFKKILTETANGNTVISGSGSFFFLL